MAGGCCSTSASARATIILEELAMEFWGGRLLASLASMGLGPDDIDVVAYSHLHADHVGWTSGDGAELTFGRARHVLSRAEWDHWETRPDSRRTDGGRRRGARGPRRARRRRDHPRARHHDRAHPRAHSRPLFVPRVVGNATRGRARRRHPLPTADQPSRVGIRRRRESGGRASGTRTARCASWTPPTRSWSGPTSPTRCSVGSWPAPCPAGSPSTSRFPRRRSRSCRTRRPARSCSRR